MPKKVPPLLWISVGMMGVAAISALAAGLQKPSLLLAAIINGALLWGIVRGSKLAFALTLGIVLWTLAYSAGEERFAYALLATRSW